MDDLIHEEIGSQDEQEQSLHKRKEKFDKFKANLKKKKTKERKKREAQAADQPNVEDGSSDDSEDEFVTDSLN
jgi:hypothetical protein